MRCTMVIQQNFYAMHDGNATNCYTMHDANATSFYAMHDGYATNCYIMRGGTATFCHICMVFMHADTYINTYMHGKITIGVVLEI